MTQTILRVFAIAVAIAGVIDPAVARVRARRPDVAVVTGALPDPGLETRVTRALESRFTIVRGPSLGAAAIVSIGEQLPNDAARQIEPAFAVFPKPSAPFVAVSSVDAPATAQLQARFPVRVGVRAMAARGRKVFVTLKSQGVVIDEAVTEIADGDTSTSVEVSMVPAGTGWARAHVSARVDGGEPGPDIEINVDVRDRRWAVLFFDLRPSWMSTFVRRAVESDPRFVVTSRVSTTRGAAVSAGAPPPTLASLPALELFQTVVIGAPESLTVADVSGLEQFMRSRGGTAVLLMDTVTDQRPFDQLTGVSRWTSTIRTEPTGEPLASEFFRPATPPAWATYLRTTDESAADLRAIWRMSVGSGRLFVSGAMDAWRYRDRNADAFDRFWRQTIANAANAAPSQTTPLTSADAHRSVKPSPDERDLVRAWTSSAHGRALNELELAELAPAVAAAVGQPPEPSVLHPMRSAWWIIPFAGALGGEWWLRRRGGRR